ncbi:MAG: cytochrome c oxidase assembly protein [Chloroflexi bacterium]|nr:cytochrome c oxidase assembly protein [Chloroflexota bacterium]
MTTRAIPAARTWLAARGRALPLKWLAAPAIGLGWLRLAGDVAAHGTFDPTPPSPWILATAWHLDPTVAVPLVATALGWLWMVDRIDRHHPHNPVPVPRTVAFVFGLFVIAVALQSGIERYDTTVFSIHMVQHLLLMLVAPPLLLLGAPITQLLRVASPGVRRRILLPFLHSGPMVFLSHPVTAWLLFTVALWGTHFSPLFDIALENPPVHQLEHALYLAAAMLFWFPVVGADPGPRRLAYPARALYLLLQMPPSSFLAMAVLFADAPLYDHYATLGAPYGVSALADQQAAGGIMWIWTDVTFIAAILLVIGAWMRSDERRTAEVEARVDEQRAALAARADRLAAMKAAAAGGPDGPTIGSGVGSAAGSTPQPGSGEASSSR